MRVQWKGINMADLVTGAHGSSSYAATPTAIKSRIVDLWPQTIVAVGVGLSLIWTAGLFWLLCVIV
jgi:hypothetical protein